MLEAIGDGLRQRGRLREGFYNEARAWLGLSGSLYAASTVQLDAAIREFGKRLRRAIDAEGQR